MPKLFAMPTPLQIKTEYLIKNYNIQLIAIVGSFILSGIALFHNQPFNVDGIWYLSAASDFLTKGIKAAVINYPWPFYSILIALVSKLTHLSLENSAYLLNALLAVIAVLTYISLVKELGGSRFLQYLALLIILIYPYLNHDRDNILRDVGYYAFAPVSLLFFIHYLRKPSWGYAMSWGISTILATLFRIEGAVILALAPFAILLKPNLSILARIGYFLRIHTINFICLAILFIWLIAKSHHIISHLGRFDELVFYLQHGVSAIFINLHTKQTILQQGLFSDNKFQSIKLFLIAGLIGIFLQSFLSTIGFLYTVLVYHALRYRLIPADTDALLAWFTYIFINVVIIGVFLLMHFFLAERYVLFLSYLLILAVPFSLATIYENWRQQKPGFTGKKWVFPLICFFLLVLLIDSIGHFGPSKTYIINAGNWVDQNTPQTSLVYSNDAQVAYYSHRSGTQYPQDFLIKNEEPLTSIQKINPANYDYIALVIQSGQKTQEQQIINLLKTQPITRFQNKRGDKVLIFKVLK